MSLLCASHHPDNGRWGEEAVKFLACLERHCADRGLEKESDHDHGKAMYLGGRSANYWVCGDLHLDSNIYLVMVCVA